MKEHIAVLENIDKELCVSPSGGKIYISAAAKQALQYFIELGKKVEDKKSMEKFIWNYDFSQALTKDGCTYPKITKAIQSYLRGEKS